MKAKCLAGSMSSKGKKKANYLILRKVLYYNAPEFFTKKASLPQWNKSYKIHFHKKSAVKADNGVLYNMLLYQDYETSTMDTCFSSTERTFPHHWSVVSLSDKRNPDNGSHLLMRVIWPEELFLFFFFWYCLISLPFPLRRGCKFRKLRVSFQIGKCCKYQ